MRPQIVKEKITEVVLSLPEDASYDDIMRELAFERMVGRGTEDVRASRIISSYGMAGLIRGTLTKVDTKTIRRP
jgi:hypothetical protein